MSIVIYGIIERYFIHKINSIYGASLDFGNTWQYIRQKYGNIINQHVNANTRECIV